MNEQKCSKVEWCWLLVIENADKYSNCLDN